MKKWFALASQALVYRHLFEKTNAKNYLVLAKHASMVSVELARDNDNPALLAMALYNLGKVQETSGEQNEALKNYKEAVNKKADRPAMLAEMKTRLAVLEYKLGDSFAIERFEGALEELKSAEERDNYAKSVW